MIDAMLCYAGLSMLPMGCMHAARQGKARQGGRAGGEAQRGGSPGGQRGVPDSRGCLGVNDLTSGLGARLGKTCLYVFYVCVCGGAHMMFVCTPCKVHVPMFELYVGTRTFILCTCVCVCDFII